MFQSGARRRDRLKNVGFDGKIVFDDPLTG